MTFKKIVSKLHLRNLFLYISSILRDWVLLSVYDVLGGIVVCQLPSPVWPFVTTWTAACQTSLSLTVSWSLCKFMSVELIMPYNHLNLCHPFLLLPSVFPSIGVFSNELVLIRWPNCWSFSFSIYPSIVYSVLEAYYLYT